MVRLFLSDGKKIDIHFPPPVNQVRSQSNVTGDASDSLETDAIKRATITGLPTEACTDRGLAWRISAVLLSDTNGSSSSLRFWVFAALEALLRGANVRTKMMICSWGVLRAVVDSILNHQQKSRSPTSTDNNADDDEKTGVLQTSFDLLGELVKDSPCALAWLCGTPCDLIGEPFSSEIFGKICHTALINLIDGNVFLRALSLTVKRNWGLQNLDSARKWMFGENELVILKGLWTVVEVDNVSQENLCCLNTAIVLLTFARNEGRLSKTIDATKSLNLLDHVQSNFTDQLVVNCDSPQVNFRKLLWYWRCYYSCRLVDRSSLENSSGIEFSELEKTVKAVCEVDEDTRSCMLTGSQVVHIPYIGNASLINYNVPLHA